MEKNENNYNNITINDYFLNCISEIEKHIKDFVHKFGLITTDLKTALGLSGFLAVKATDMGDTVQVNCQDYVDKAVMPDVICQYIAPIRIEYCKNRPEKISINIMSGVCYIKGNPYDAEFVLDKYTNLKDFVDYALRDQSE